MHYQFLFFNYIWYTEELSFSIIMQKRTDSSMEERDFEESMSTLKCYIEDPALTHVIQTRMIDVSIGMK